MRNHIRYIIYLYVFIGYSFAVSGSYDDFFNAIKENDHHLILNLLQRGFDPNTPNPKGEHGLMLAIRENSSAVIQTFLDWPKTNLDARNLADETPLMLASLKGLTSLVRTLIDHDADVNKPGWAPLHYAATGGHVEVLGLLLDNHAYIDAESPNGTTPLMMAARYGSFAGAQLLIDRGADVSLKNALGLAALDFANEAHREDVADLIRSSMKTAKP